MCQVLVEIDKFDCGHDKASSPNIQRGSCRRRPCSAYEPVFRFGNPRFPCDSCRQDENNLERFDGWGNMGRGRVPGCPPGSTRHGEDDVPDYVAELVRQIHEMLPREVSEMRAEHRIQVEFNGRAIELDAGPGPRLPRSLVGVIAAAIQNLSNLAPFLAPLNLFMPPPVRQPAGRGRRREQPHRQPQWPEPEFSSTRIRGNFNARAEYRSHLDDDDGYTDGDNDSTTFCDPYEMTLGRRVRFG